MRAPRSIWADGLRVLAVAAAMSAGCIGTCGDNTARAIDAASGDGAPPGDGGPGIDAPAPLTSIDFAIGGCPLTGAGCEGPNPLALQFTPIAAAQVDVYLWSFGDGATSSEAAPRHTYVEPGTYTVSLDVEGAGGAIGVTKSGAVVVSAGELGAPCTADEHCETGLCVCGDGDGACPPGLAGRGFCAADCSADTCEDGVCVDLAPSNPGSPEDWQRQLCVPDCTSAGCGRELECRSLRAAAGDWVRGCFVSNVMADIGESCAGADGAPDDERCTSGLCLAEGARGLCAHDCSSDGCPDGAECATFGGPLGAQCLRSCDAAFACDADPWLGCEDPGGGGDQGFTVQGAASPGGYCAPKSCAAPSECGTEGQCTAGYCGP